MTVQVNRTETPSFTQINPICAGGSFSLPATSNNGIAGSWSPVVNNTATTTYTFTPNAAAHPCAVTATMTVQVSTRPVVSISAENPGCFGEQLGRLTIESISGGIPPYSYAIGNDPLSIVGALPATNPNRLTAGAYQLRVQDGGNCLTIVPFVIPDAPLLQLDLGPDMTIRIGDSTLLEGLTNFDVDSVVWTPTEFLSDAGSPVTYARPTVSTAYQLVAFDVNGCRAEDEVWVYVERRLEVFIPNAFSPNDDGINDKFRVFSDNKIKSIRSLRVFDRWGGNVFSVTDVAPDADAAGWDGKHRGQTASADVYVYFAEIEFFDGHVETVMGEVTLVR